MVDSIGISTRKVVDALLTSCRVEQQTYRSCMGLLKPWLSNYQQMAPLVRTYGSRNRFFRNFTFLYQANLENADYSKHFIISKSPNTDVCGRTSTHRTGGSAVMYYSLMQSILSIFWLYHNFLICQANFPFYIQIEKHLKILNNKSIILLSSKFRIMLVRYCAHARQQFTS